MGTNYKSVVGVDDVYMALITQDDADAYAAGTPAYLAPVMTIAQAPAVNSKVQYADNQPFETLTTEGETKLDVEITGLPLDNLATILGRVYDATLGRMFDNGGTAPYVALGFRTKKSDGLYRYYWFLKGMFATPAEDSASQSDTPDPKSTKLAFTAIRTIHQFALTGSITDSVKRVVGDDADTAFDGDTWFDAVQVPSVGSPSALTCTPYPADNAPAVDPDVNITLTFNNALGGGSEEGIILVDDVTQAAVACARTISTTRKVVTLTPTDPLAGTNYLIIVAGVVDVFGQPLATAVYNFALEAEG